MVEGFRRRWRARCLFGLTRVTRVVPTPCVRGALDALAPLAALTRFQRTTESNLELALGAETSRKQREHIARGVRSHAARLAAEWLRLARGAAPDSRAGEWIEAAVRVDASIEHLERELAFGRGALIATAHLGNWELLAARLRRAGHRGVVVGYRRPNDPSATWLESMRRGYGVETLPHDHNPRAILAALRAGLVVGILSDLEVRRAHGEFLPFFGRPALTSTAPAAIARVHGGPILAARCVADGPRGTYRLASAPPPTLDPALAGRAATSDLARRLNQVYERWIRANPEQWAWHQPRWRTQPGDLEPIPYHARRARIREARAAPAVFTKR